MNQAIIRRATREQDNANLFSPFEFILQDLECKDNKFTISNSVLSAFSVQVGDIVEYTGTVNGGSHYLAIVRVLRRVEMN